MNVSHASAAPLLQPLFSLGRLCTTPGALATLASLSLSPWSFLARHQRGDWGDLDADDRRANTLAVIQGSRVFSAYDLGHHQSLWIITEADRSVTTLLLPEEY
ncbi:hypothetical protein HW932_10840 [Allochromatium humboldtianum]|uniref:Type I restriction endonuclease subunit M n=1 Tax=Allochromatium humboldtianum TaxID=504901 RepID=A0A850REJ6_9GAMM|nr:hypothetical protein [Allochromatium humboldtianum]NVZ09757.1 hypothetical protein [Allochromatium humboldtianum]